MEFKQRGVKVKEEKFYPGFIPVLADKFLVFGEFNKKLCLDFEVPESKVEIIGFLKTDALFKRKFNPKKFKKSIGVKDHEKIIMFATQPCLSGFVFDDAFKAIKQILYERPELKLVVKIHPMETVDKYKKTVGKHGLVLGDIDLYELLNVSSVVIQEASSVGLEALLLGKPLIIFTHRPPIDSTFNNSQEEILHAHNPAQLFYNLILALDFPEKVMQIEKPFVDKVISFQGKATEQIIQVIKRELKK